MRGWGKVVKPIPPVYAIPTTAGTGSEGTFCSVVTDASQRIKFFLLDPKLTPQAAFLDPIHTLSMPKEIAVATGFDALTHAVESFISRSHTRKSSLLGSESVGLVFKNLKKTVENPEDLEARGAMQSAAYQAGLAFSVAYLGYVHAITHTLGALYHVSHGYANAILLPPILEFYGGSAQKRLALLSEVTGTSDPGDSEETKAQRFISAIKEMAGDLGIPSKFTDTVHEKDMELIMDRAFSETFPSSPVPRFMSREEMRDILHSVM
jgi:alcohol dehydrogenase class IV